jgi:hypothetical protein
VVPESHEGLACKCLILLYVLIHDEGKIGALFWLLVPYPRSFSRQRLPSVRVGAMRPMSSA